jgi:hypothetical protein
MKSKDLQNMVPSKYQNGDAPTKICRDLNGGISFAQGGKSETSSTSKLF